MSFAFPNKFKEEQTIFFEVMETVFILWKQFCISSIFFFSWKVRIQSDKQQRLLVV